MGRVGARGEEEPSLVEAPQRLFGLHRSIVKRRVLLGLLD